MKSQLLAAGLLCFTSAMLAQDYLFVVDGAVRVDRSCHVQLRPDANGKTKEKKIDALCMITKDKDVYATRSVMSNGMPRIGHVQLIEMEYSLSNPTKAPLKFELTYHMDKGFTYDPNSGPPPSSVTNVEVKFEPIVQPGEVVRIDLAERK
jgi:hypothetical protein